MSPPEVFERQVEGVMQSVEVVTAFLGVFKDGRNGWIFAVDFTDIKRAAFQDFEAARRWCRTANHVMPGLPKTNAEITAFNEALKARGWRVTSHLGVCPVWEGHVVPSVSSGAVS